MGNRSSSSSQSRNTVSNNVSCNNCAAPIADPLIDGSGVESCRRCGWITAQRSTKSRSSNPSQRYAVPPSNRNDENKSSSPAVVDQLFNTPPSTIFINNNRYHQLSIIQIIPFQESLSDEIKALANSDYTVGNSVLLEEVVQPFFQSLLKNPSIINNALITSPTSTTTPPRLVLNGDDGKSFLFLESGIRLKISRADHTFEFKILNCYPPNGVLTEQTKFFAFNRPLSNKAIISRMELAPTQASLQSLSNNGSNRSPHVHRPSRSTLLSTYIRPFFQSADPNRHYNEGELFVSQGIQFKIVNAAPTNGTVNAATEFIVSSETIKDMKKIHLLPILETLPNNFKSSTADQRIHRYLAPYFLGSGLTVSKNDKIEIDGVKWKVISSEPDKGLVTTASTINAEGTPLNSDDVKRQQELDDEALARQLQFEEAAVDGYSSMGLMIRGARDRRSSAAERNGTNLSLAAPRTPNRSTATQNATPTAASTPSSASSSSSSSTSSSSSSRANASANPSESLRHRLTELLQLMPENDPHRVVFERLNQQLALAPFTGSPDRNLLSLLIASPSASMGAATSATNPAATPHDGATQAELDALPCHEFKKRFDDQKSEASTEANTCRVCLDEYENGDIIRTLPCFHQGHKACFDNWLLQKPLCPCCRFSIRSAHH